MCRMSFCGRCGESFTSHARRGPTPKWCQSCKARVAVEQHAVRRRLRTSTRYPRRCVYCSQEWLAKSPAARYCSERCQHLASGGRVVLKCKRCGCDFECKALEMKAGRQFCSKACMLNATRRALKPCLECGKPFAPKPKKDPRKGKGLYCSKRCAGAARRAGKRIGRWKEAQEIRACRARVKPSEKMYASMQQAMRQHWASIASLYASLNASRACLHCGSWIDEQAHERTLFCSIRCAASHEHQISCRLCGKSCTKRGVQGGRGMCPACKKMAKKARSKKGYRRKMTKVCERDGWRCQLCFCRLIKTWKVSGDGVPHMRCRTLDHIVPRVAGGTDDEWNLQACCFKCNYEKGKTRKGQLRLAIKT